MDNNEYIKLQIEGSDWSFGSAWGDQMERAITEWFGSAIPKTSRVLDAACGEGRGLLGLRNMGFTSLVGVDVSDEKLAAALKRELNVIKSDIQNLPFKDDAFDYCFSSHTLEHMSSISLGVSSLLRVAPKLCYIIPVHETPEFVKNHNPSHVSPINDPEEFIKIISDLGFKHTYFLKTRLCDELWGVVERT